MKVKILIKLFFFFIQNITKYNKMNGIQLVKIHLESHFNLQINQPRTKFQNRLNLCFKIIKIN